jgi:hypothetical protein
MLMAATEWEKSWREGIVMYWGRKHMTYEKHTLERQKSVVARCYRCHDDAVNCRAPVDAVGETKTGQKPEASA